MNFWNKEENRLNVGEIEHLDIYKHKLTKSIKDYLSFIVKYSKQVMNGIIKKLPSVTYKFKNPN